MFPETFLNVVGFGKDRQGIFRVITKQRIIKGEEPSVEDLDKLSKQLNLEKKGSWYYTKDGKRISDLNPKNVLKVPAINDTEEDIFFVIDCDIEFTSEHLQQSDINSTENTQSQKLDTFYSGGATGADTYWSDAMAKHGITVTHIKTEDYDSLDSENRQTVNNQYKDIVRKLGRKELSEDSYGGKLVRRDMMQANNASAVYAVADIDFTGKVNGGTAYAVMRGIQKKIPVYVFDQKTNTWMMFDYQQNSFVPSTPNVIQNGAALIGAHGRKTEQFTEQGKKAIDDLVNRTFNQQSQQSNTQQSAITKNILNQLLAHLKKGAKVYFSAEMKEYLKKHNLEDLQKAIQYNEEITAIKDAAIKNGTFMKAPNGKPTKLNEQQWLQVRTTNFKNWFGDWENDPQNASKIVDENGEPKVMWHTAKRGKFEGKQIFRKGTNGGKSGDGIYFAFSRYETFANIKGSYTYQVFLNMRNPLTRDFIKNHNLDDIYVQRGGRIIELNDLERVVNEYGFDGTFAVGALDEVTVFEPNQIKSAIDNNGNFSLTDDDIRAAWGRPSVNNKMSDEEKENIRTLLKTINRTGTTLLDNGEGTMYLLDHADKEDIENRNPKKEDGFNCRLKFSTKGLSNEFINNIKKEIENGTIRDQKTINRRIKDSFRGQGSYVSDSIVTEVRTTNADNVGLYTETQFRESLGRRSDTSSTKDFGTGFVKVYENDGTNGPRYTSINQVNDLSFFTTPQGEIYGFVTKDGEIYLDETVISPEHPIHEYTHLWDRMVQQQNPELWKRGVELMKKTSMWTEIANDIHYGKLWEQQGITGTELEDRIASEVHARFTGEGGAKLLDQIAKEKGSEGIIAKLKDWIKEFWSKLKATFSNWSKEDLDKLTLKDFNHMTVRDFADGVNFENLSQQSQQLTDEQLTERAYNYTVENLDKLVDDYISNAGNTIDPDAIREVYKPLGYTGKNVPAFRKAEKLLTETIFEKMIDKAVAEGKTSMTFLTGVPGSGKSSSLRNNNMDLSDQGIVYDAAFNGSDKLIKYIKKVQDRGLKNVTVLAVHNDAITSFTNTLNRGIATGRFLSLQYFLDGAFSENIGKIKRLKEKCPDINIIPIDNSGNNGGKQVTVEEAMNWDYNVTEELVYKLLNIIEDEISKGNISGEQITSVGRDVLEIEALVSERNKSIANRINRQIQRNTGNNQGETGLSGLGVNSQSQPTSVLSNLIQPKKGVDLKKATAKASIANKFIGFGAPNSSTELYQKQAGEYANVGNYTKDDTVFVSINGKVKNAIEYQLQTIDEAVKAIRSGARLLTDSAEYLDKSSYNTGEKLLAEHLKLIGATYQTIDIDGEKVGQWTFSTKMQATNITIAQLADAIGNENVITDRTIATEIRRMGHFA